MSLGVAGQHRVLTFKYTLKDGAGQVLGNTGDKPMSILEGFKHILPALEREIKDMDPGDTVIVKIPSAHAYGPRDEKKVVSVPKETLAHLIIKPGTFLQIDLGRGQVLVFVKEINDKDIIFDGNHPMAGKDLEFEVEMLQTRLATGDEVFQGRVL